MTKYGGDKKKPVNNSVIKKKNGGEKCLRQKLKFCLKNNWKVGGVAPVYSII